MPHDAGDVMTRKKWVVRAVVLGVALVAVGAGAIASYPYASELWLQRRLAAGDADAAAPLSRLYWSRALDHCDNPAEARAILGKGRTILRKQAEAGNVEAMFELGFQSRDALCDGVPADLPDFFKWMEAAANKGHRPAMGMLSGYYFSASASDDPDAQARGVVWLMKEAELGDSGSQAAIGHRYLYGIALPKDANKAREWLEKASAQGEASATRDLGLIHASGVADGSMRRLAIPMLTDAANGGDIEAAQDLANIYMEGTVVPQNYAEARRWAAKAAPERVQSQLLLAALYLEGKGGEKDLAEAYAWASVAKAAANDPIGDEIMAQAEKEGGRQAVEDGQAKAAKYAKTVQTMF